MQKELRKIVVSPDYKFTQYTDWQKLYKDEEFNNLIRDTELYVGDELKVKINSFGCRGNDIDPSLPTILCIGDSTTFCCSSINDHWPLHLGLNGIQILNAGIEGMNMENMLKRVIYLTRQINICAIICAPSWHNLIYGQSGKKFWIETWEKIRQNKPFILLSIPTSLHEDWATKGVESLLNNSVKEDGSTIAENLSDLNSAYFNFWAAMPNDTETIRLLHTAILSYNKTAKEYCEKTNSVFVDLYTFMYPANYLASRLDFYDVCHLRPKSYRIVGTFIGNTIKSIVSKQNTQNDLRAQMYTVW